MGEPERVPEHEFEGEAEGPVEMRVQRMPKEGIEEAPTAEIEETPPGEIEKPPTAKVVEGRRLEDFNPSVLIAAASMAAAVLMVTSVAILAPTELGFVVPWMLGSLTVLGVGLGVTATILRGRK